MKPITIEKEVVKTEKVKLKVPKLSTLDSSCGCGANVLNLSVNCKGIGCCECVFDGRNINIVISHINNNQEG